MIKSQATHYRETLIRVPIGTLVKSWLLLLILISTCHENAASLSSSSNSKTNSKSNILVSGGLANLGNTCYLNSQLECAYHIPHLRKIVVSPTDNSNPTDCPISRNVGLLSLQQQFQSMEMASKRGNGDPIVTPSVSTSILCRNLGINVYEQQDSQEFWKLLLPEIDHPDLSELYRGKYDSYIAALDGSGREKTRTEMFLDLSLDVANFGSVYDSLDDMLTSGEILSEKEGNGWRPEKGADKVDALKGNSICSEGLPKVLQLHLMRFTYDWQTQVMSKINDRFSFSKELDLSEICKDTKKGDENAIFDLQSIVVHAGEYGSGHYYAYVRPDIRRNKWYRYDDDRVAEVSFRDVKNDAFGGYVGNSQSQKARKKVGFLKRILSSANPKRNQFGWGGRSSSAYMLQYVKRSDIPFLYD